MKEKPGEHSKNQADDESPFTNFQDYLDRVKAYRETDGYQKAMRKRALWTEPLFGEAKDYHRLRRFRLRGLQKVNIEGKLVATGQNLKRLMKHLSNQH